VDLAGVAKLERFMDRKGTVLRGNLAAGTCLAGEGKHLAVEDGLEVVFVPPWDIRCSYMGGITFSPAIWNRALLRDALEPQWTLWDAERCGTDRMKRRHPEVMSVGTRPGLLTRAHGLRHAEPRTAHLEELEPEDREAVRGMVPAGWRVVG
jgi:hypothetical protein